jgi:hypothetical protein
MDEEGAIAEVVLSHDFFRRDSTMESGGDDDLLALGPRFVASGRTSDRPRTSGGAERLIRLRERLVAEGERPVPRGRLAETLAVSLTSILE